MSDQQVIFSMVRVTAPFPPNNKQVIRDISLGFYYGAKIGVLGLNGSGKSTLLRIIAGKDDGYTGEVTFSPGYSVGLLEQEPQLDNRRPSARWSKKPCSRLSICSSSSTKSATNLRPRRRLRPIDRRTGPPARSARQARCLEPGQPPGSSHGCPALPAGRYTHLGPLGRRAPPRGLCRLLLTEPDILLLDEPTNHLDAESVAWLERHLQQYKGTVIAVTHDRYFLDNVAGWILELDRGYGIPWRGNYSSWLEQKQERIRKEEKPRASACRRCSASWSGSACRPSARQAKGKARVTSYETCSTQEYEKRREELEIYIPPGPRLGNVVIEFDGVSKAYGDRLLIDNMNVKIPPGSIMWGSLAPTAPAKPPCCAWSPAKRSPIRAPCIGKRSSWPM
jgi:energy-dependent translational throttle protein EttA